MCCPWQCASLFSLQLQHDTWYEGKQQARSQWCIPQSFMSYLVTADINSSSPSDVNSSGIPKVTNVCSRHLTSPAPLSDDFSRLASLTVNNESTMHQMLHLHTQSELTALVVYSCFCKQLLCTMMTICWVFFLAHMSRCILLWPLLPHYEYSP